MRMPKYISPTALQTWEKNPEDYYLNYLAEIRPPRIAQTQPMSVGAAFDAYIKSYFHETLFGKNHKDSNLFEFQTIFESQVEPHNRDWALENGKYAFECYRISGAMSDLLLTLQAAISEPRFEFTIEGTVGDVPLLGKPDVYFIHKNGKPIILDWKVNGYCSKSPKSPEKGYVNVRDGWVGTPSRGSNRTHKDAFVINIDGIRVNVAIPLEQINTDWAVQTSTYAWLCGAQIGEQFIVAIDQLCCSPGKKIRVAEHRCTISAPFQLGVVNRYKSLWETIHSDHILRSLSKEDSKRRCEMLELTYQAYADMDDVDRAMFERG